LYLAYRDYHLLRRSCPDFDPWRSEFHHYYPTGDPRPRNTLEVRISVAEQSKCIKCTIPKTAHPGFKRTLYKSQTDDGYDAGPVHQLLLDAGILEPLYIDPFYSLTRPYVWRQGLIDGKCVARPCLCEDCFRVTESNMPVWQESIDKYFDRLSILTGRIRLGWTYSPTECAEFLANFEL